MPNSQSASSSVIFTRSALATYSSIMALAAAWSSKNTGRQLTSMSTAVPAALALATTSSIVFRVTGYARPSVPDTTTIASSMSSMGSLAESMKQSAYESAGAPNPAKLRSPLMDLSTYTSRVGCSTRCTPDRSTPRSSSRATSWSPNSSLPSAVKKVHFTPSWESAVATLAGAPPGKGVQLSTSARSLPIWSSAARQSNSASPMVITCDLLSGASCTRALRCGAEPRRPGRGTGERGLARGEGLILLVTPPGRWVERDAAGGVRAGAAGRIATPAVAAVVSGRGAIAGGRCDQTGGELSSAGGSARRRGQPESVA
mmetsp:Transcript_23550/g.59179  ORF Transcript_23550/g.59179 Transcript_23550/m.59179 type:complete len:315 (-) Transcript_23550:199-1143(-)